MAVRNFSYYDGSIWGGLTMNIWVDAPQVTINVTGSTFKVDTWGAMKIKGTCSDKDYYPAEHQMSMNVYNNSNTKVTASYGFTVQTGMLKSNTYGTATKVSAYTPSISTSDYFNGNNPTERTLRFTSKMYSVITDVNGSAQTSHNYSSSPVLITDYDITLDVPPTATVSTLSVDTAPYVYAGLSTASVTVSDATAYYGGDVDSATLTIGNQTASISGDGTLSILLNASGTFTPVVTITDSRGQVKEYQLDPITVGTYSTPTVNFDAQRTDVNGKIADEGEYATIVTTLTFDPVAEAVAPSVAVADEDGITQTATTTWYSTRASDGTLSGAVTWSTLASGSTVYGLISITGDFDTQKSYVISLTPQDSESITGDTKTDTLQTAFYTVDFLAGGHGIAFGQPASQEGFYCNMDANFVDANDVMRALFDFIHPVGSYYETSDTSFDPNVTWGGTWSLETEGQVHISAGANYTVSGALTDTTDGGASTVTLQQSEMPEHTHGNKSLKGTMRAMAWTGAAVSGIVTKSDHNVNRNDNTGSNLGAATFTINASHEHTSAGGGQAHNNMQPYIVVNRWHRTA